jgi:teichuronic acid biosynthesis glycosyltransferase TuaC
MNILITTTEYEEAPFIMDQIKTLRRSEFSVTIFKFSPKKNPLNYIKARIKLKKIVRSKKFDLIHAHYGQSGFISKFNGVPLITTFHGTDVMGIVGKDGSYTLMGRALTILSKLTSLISDSCICVSSRIANRLPNTINKNIIPCGIDTRIFKKMDKLKCRESLKFEKKKYILFAGNPLIGVKNYKLALQSFDMYVKNSNVDACLIPLKGYDRSQVPELLNAVDLLLMTSKHEGSPMVIKEAIACRTPIVSVDVGDVKELIEDIPGSYVVKRKSAKKISDKIKKSFLQNDSEKSDSSVKSIDLEHINNKLIITYKNLIKEYYNN